MLASVCKHHDIKTNQNTIHVRIRPEDIELTQKELLFINFQLIIP